MTMTSGDSSRSASPYATGGGGTVLEHRYGAVLLAHLLTADPVRGLGDDAVPVSITFQASPISPVDDLLVVGRTPDGGERRLSIGVRRSPSLTRSEGSTVDLLVPYLQVVTAQWDEVRAGRSRLGLAVSSPNAAAKQLRTLTDIARASTDNGTFRSDVDRPRRTNQRVRDRLGHIGTLVQTAAAEAGLANGVESDELTWRLLRSLYVLELRLEEGDEADRTTSVGRLRTVVRDGTPAAASQLFSTLAELVGRYAPAAARVTEESLRGDLPGTPLGRSPSRQQAWDALERLARRLRDRTRFGLTDATGSLELDRAEARQDLVAEMEGIGSGGTLLVHGEPDVGKSALTLRATEAIESGGGVVIVLSLRDIPNTMTQIESLLGGDMAEILSATETGAVRILVIDGAESALEGRAQLLTDLATAALRASLGVVAVSRRDGTNAVTRALYQASESAGVTEPARAHEVGGLSLDETRQVATTFDSLARLRDEPRAAWLLARPGLLDLLLRAEAAGDLPSGPLSEAEVFAVVWHRLIRRGEAHPPGESSPDARENAMVQLARQLLLPDERSEPDASALPSLRHDGLLFPLGPASAWTTGDRFASDLIRDFAIARLLIQDGWTALGAVGPRFALRSARLACQAAFAASATDTESVRVQLQEEFDALASRHGRRWAEVPLEAMLTLGSSREALTRAWPALIADDGARLRTVLRLAVQRHTQRGIGDTLVLAPLVELAYCGDDQLSGSDSHAHRDLREQVQNLVLAFLRGLILEDVVPDTLRQRVRDRILARQPQRWDEFDIEALATLGPDLDVRAETHLRTLADDGGAHLAPAVESVGASQAMSMHQPELLIALAEAFYIELPDDRPSWSYSPRHDGIRHHQMVGGVGIPLAAWYYGPFFRLLNTRPAEAIALINRMLDHAAATRVRPLDQSRTRLDPSDVHLPGLDLDLPGIGMRRCVGDRQVWYWYRGSSVGPYACMSAMLAVERFADHLVDTLGLPLSRVTELLLRDCNNLAMPGLVVGLLARHIEQAGDLLDRWLSRPEVWIFEFQRVVAEGQLHVQGPDAADLVGRDQRRSSFREVAVQLTLRAVLGEDILRFTVLAAVADELLCNARNANESSAPSELAVVEGWASMLRPENYHASDANNGDVIVQYEPPTDVISALAPSSESLGRGNDAMRLLVTYAASEDRDAPVEMLLDDLRIAQAIAQDPPLQGPLPPIDPVAAVAAAAIVAQAESRASIPMEDLQWAGDILIDAASNPATDRFSSAESVFPTGADRSAAVALPALLLLQLHGGHVRLSRIEDALHQSATSLFDEVRMSLAGGLSRVWTTSCAEYPGVDLCVHMMALELVQAGLKDCRLGAWSPEVQRRPVDPLDGPYERTLAEVTTGGLRLNRLIPALIAAAEAAQGQSCVASEAEALLDALIDAFRRSSLHWAIEGYGGSGAFHDRRRQSAVRVLVALAVGGNVEPLADHMRSYTSNARALDQLLRDLAIIFSCDDLLRQALPQIWRIVMTAALDAIDAGADLLGADHWSDGAIAGLLPTPQPDIADTDPDTTLERAGRNWVRPADIADLVLRWIPIAHREPRALDALSQFARLANSRWQIQTGLVWAEDLIDDHHAAIAGKCWFLVDWLQSVRSYGTLSPEELARWRRIVDGLAAEGDTRAANLQQAEE